VTKNSARYKSGNNLLNHQNNYADYSNCIEWQNYL